MTSQPVVEQSEDLASDASRWLGEHCRLVVAPYHSPTFAQTIPNAAGLVIRTFTQVDRALLDRAGELRVVGRAGAGLDNIDVAACRARGVEVVYAPDANTQSVVEFVIALICDALRPRPPLAEAVDGDHWEHLRARDIGRSEIAESTVGILGLGRIGRRVAAVATTIGSRVIYNDLLEIPPEDRGGAAPVSAAALFEESDVLSVHVDGRAANRHLIGDALLGRMKDHAVLINTSRGFVVDNVALAALLDRRPDVRAYLDVHDPEPFDATYPLLGRPNAVLYPHLASRTGRALREMSWVVRDVVSVLEGRAPRYPAPATE